jgi:hypothetical protein
MPKEILRGISKYLVFCVVGTGMLTAGVLLISVVSIPLIGRFVTPFVIDGVTASSFAVFAIIISGVGLIGERRSLRSVAGRRRELKFTFMLAVGSGLIGAALLVFHDPFVRALQAGAVPLGFRHLRGVHFVRIGCRAHPRSVRSRHASDEILEPAQPGSDYVAVPSASCPRAGTYSSNTRGSDSRGAAHSTGARTPRPGSASDRSLPSTTTGVPFTRTYLMPVEYSAGLS